MKYLIIAFTLVGLSIANSAIEINDNTTKVSNRNQNVIIQCSILLNDGALLKNVYMRNHTICISPDAINVKIENNKFYMD